MSFRAPPRYAAWQHRDARDGFEVAFVHSEGAGYRLEGATAAFEDGEPWAVQYVMTLDSEWSTRSAKVSGRARIRCVRARAGRGRSGPMASQRRGGAAPRRLSRRRFGIVLAHQRVSRPPPRTRDRRAGRRARRIRPRRRSQRRAASTALYAARELRERTSVTTTHLHHSGLSASWFTTSSGSCSNTPGSRVVLPDGGDCRSPSGPGARPLRRCRRRRYPAHRLTRVPGRWTERQDA